MPSKSNDLPAFCSGIELERACALVLEHVAAGELIAFPTETVWALGAAVESEEAVARLRRWKGRGAEQPISVLVPNLAALEDLGVEVPASARRLAARWWPGPLTLVLRCLAAAFFASGVARKDGAVGFRCSPHPFAGTLVRHAARAGIGPLTATSLNRSGMPPAGTLDEARALCVGNGESPWLFEALGPDAGGGAPSSVVDLTGPRAVVLREGAIAAAAIEALAAADSTGALS